ncbi:MAG: hypothetical protein M3P06_10500 [Acidobacteriota bacterium]|nr:hypothetical protein [Acidobacteriota bacterium]
MTERDEKFNLGEVELTYDEVMRLTPGERIDMVWPLTKIAWGITEDTPLRRDIVRVIRPKR